MTKQVLFRGVVGLIIGAAMISGSWWSLQQNSAFILRDQPLLQLTPQQETQIKNLPNPLTLEIYSRGNPQLRRSLQAVITPFQLLQPNLQTKFINPDLDPLRVQEREITREGQLYLTDGERGQRIDILSPQSLATALLAFSPTGESQILHLQGHGERAYISDSAGNWRGFYNRLRSAKLQISDLDQSRTKNIPKSTNLLIIADPEEISIADSSALQTYLALGGDLLYTTDSTHPYLPPWLEKLTGLRLVSGVVIDAAAQSYGLNDPQMLVVENLGNHPINQGLKQAPLLPTAVALEIDSTHPPTSDWKRTPLLWSSEKSWAERGNIYAATLQPDEHEQRGPLVLGWILEREILGKKQKIVLLGDSDLFQNQYFSVGGNSQFIHQLFDYLLPDGAESKVASPNLVDQFLTLPEAEKMPLAIVLILALPALPLILALLIRWKRKRKYG